MSRGSLFSYGFLAIPIAFAGFPLYVLAPDFYATQHGVSLSVLGLVLLVLRAFDAVQDPFIGNMSDRYSASALPLMIGAGLLLVFSIYLLFNHVAVNPVFWFAICMAVAVTAYSILSINLNTFGALSTHDEQEQTRVAGMREALGLVGLLLAVTAPQILKNLVPAEAVYIWFSAILAGLMVVGLLLFARWFSQAKKPTANATSKIKIWASLHTLPDETRKLYLVYGLSVLASSIPAILVIFFIRDRLNAEAETGLFLLLYFLAGALAMPLWKKLSEKCGKHRAWFMATMLAVASFIGAFFLGAGDVWPYAIICITSGIALGADLALPPAILADQIHHHNTSHAAATQYSILALLTKAGLAIGSAISLPLLDVAGFVPGGENTASALLGLSAAYALIPCAIKLASAYLLYRFFIQPKGISHDNSKENNPHRSHHHAQ